MEEAIQKIIQVPSAILYSLDTYLALIDLPNNLATSEIKVEIVTNSKLRKEYLEQLGSTYYPKQSFVKYSLSNEFHFGEIDILMVDLTLGMDPDSFSIVEFWKFLSIQGKRVPRLVLVSPEKEINLGENIPVISLNPPKPPYQNRYETTLPLQAVKQYMEIPELNGNFLLIVSDSKKGFEMADELTSYTVDTDIKLNYPSGQSKKIIILPFEIADLAKIEECNLTFDTFLSSQSLAEVHSYKSKMTLRFTKEEEFFKLPSFIISPEDDFRMALKSYLLNINYPIDETVNKTIQNLHLVEEDTITEGGLFALMSPTSVINSGIIYNSKGSFSNLVIASLLENGPYFNYSLKTYDQDSSDYSYEIGLEIKEMREKFEGDNDLQVYINIYNNYVTSNQNYDLWILENRIMKEKWSNMIETLNYLFDLVESFNFQVVETPIMIDYEAILDAYKYYQMRKYGEGNVFTDEKLNLYSLERFGKVSKIVQKLPEKLTALQITDHLINLAI